MVRAVVGHTASFVWSPLYWTDLHPLAFDGKDEEGGICLSLNGEYRTDAFTGSTTLGATKGDVHEQ